MNSPEPCVSVVYISQLIKLIATIANHLHHLDTRSGSAMRINVVMMIDLRNKPELKPKRTSV
jgi:hypothetical protein